MIGLSLSFCVKDIALGFVKEEEVERIVAGTHYQNDREFEELLVQYAKGYWNRDNCNPETAIAIARRLKAADKIFQPREIYSLPPTLWGGYWCEKTTQVMENGQIRWVGVNFIEVKKENGNTNGK